MTGNLRDAIRAAFDAGCEQGSDEATAHEWGSLLQQSRDEAFADFMAEWNPDSAPIRAAMTPTHRSDPMTDKLRIAQNALDDIAAARGAFGVDAEADCSWMMRRAGEALAALAAAPQPAPTHECPVCGEEVTWNGPDRPYCGECAADNGRDVKMRRIAAAPQPAPETMAWAVVGRDGKPRTGALFNWPETAHQCKVRGERVVRVAIRVVEGGDDAA